MAMKVNFIYSKFASTVKLGNKEWFDKEQIGIKEPFPVTNLPFTDLMVVHCLPKSGWVLFSLVLEMFFVPQKIMYYSCL